MEAAALVVPRGKNALDRLSGIYSGRGDPKDLRWGTEVIDPAMRFDWHSSLAIKRAEDAWIIWILGFGYHGCRIRTVLRWSQRAPFRLRPSNLHGLSATQILSHGRNECRRKPKSHSSMPDRAFARHFARPGNLCAQERGRPSSRNWPHFPLGKYEGRRVQRRRYGDFRPRLVLLDNRSRSAKDEGGLRCVHCRRKKTVWEKKREDHAFFSNPKINTSLLYFFSVLQQPILCAFLEVPCFATEEIEYTQYNMKKSNEQDFWKLY